MRAPVEVHDALARLVEYPRDGFDEVLEHSVGVVESGCPAAAPLLAPFVEYARSRRPGELEEEFARTFDNTADRALEVGWHVFGENYTRGTFLVTMRGLLREHGVEESGELPDHLSHCLAVLGRLEAKRAADLCSHSIGPAAQKVHDELASITSPWTAVLAAVLVVLELHAPPAGWTPLNPVAPMEEPCS